MKLARAFWFLVFLLLAGTTGYAASRLFSQQAPPAGGPPRGGSPVGGDLVKALKESPGCIGVEVGGVASGKQVIFAWFKDKAATLDWYYSDYHQTAMQGLKEAGDAAAGATAEPAKEEERYEPMAHVPDDCGPILCIASITPGAKQTVPGFPMPISQIAIELYAPLPGGIAFNGRFSPKELKVPHLVDLSPEEEPAAPSGSKGN